MLQAMLAGVASIKAQQTRMNVIGNNLANVNTTAYKGSRVTFKEMITQNIRGAARPTAEQGGANPLQLGLGVIMSGTDANQEQGSLNATNRPTDMAIQGSGYFMLSDGVGISYTRDGSFDVDANGDLVHRATGQRMLGYQADNLGNIDTSTKITGLSYLNIPLGSLSAVQATSRVTMSGNLSATAASTDQVTTQFRVYDALGAAHTLSFVLTNRAVLTSADTPTPPAGATSSWDWKAYEGDPSSGVLVGDSEGTVTGTVGEKLYFDANGRMVSGLALGSFNSVVVPGANGTDPITIQVDFSQIGQLDTASQVNAKDQNGFPPGSLSGFSIGPDGIISGLFTNGLARSLGQVSMAIFANPNGLERYGNNLLRQTSNSGVAVTGTPRTGGRGVINTGFLEQSNVDIGNEFTDLIVTQRGFQANTKVVTTVDEMLQDLINMKR